MLRSSDYATIMQHYVRIKILLVGDYCFKSIAKFISSTISLHSFDKY